MWEFTQVGDKLRINYKIEKHRRKRESLTVPQPGTKILPLGKAPFWRRSKTTGFSFPISHGTRPSFQQLFQPPKISDSKKVLKNQHN